MAVEVLLKSLETTLAPYRKMLGQAIDTIQNENVSEYPILVLSQQEIQLGIPLGEKNSFDGKWSINASTLEEFVARQLIESGKLENFKSIYKDPKNFLCFFVIADIGATFVFLPRK